MLRLLSPVIAAFLLWSVGAAPLAAQPKNWSDDEVRAILAERVDVHRRSVGIVVGLIGSEGRRIVTYGQRSKDDPRPLDGDTLFEIGSITKVFTAFLLADMDRRGEVSITDPVAKYLPAQVIVPERNGRVMTLRDLSGHRSGLPRMPTNFAPQVPGDPYVDYTVEQLYAFLSGYQLTRDIGERYEYSNLAVALLGQALARRAGMDFETLIRTRIIDPLRLPSTRITLTPEMKARLAVGHDADLEPVPNWNLATFDSSGGLRSSANDLLDFLVAFLAQTPPSLAPAMAKMLEHRTPAWGPDADLGLGWVILKLHDDEIIAHAGGTGGYQSYVAYSTKSRTGVVVLSNAQGSIEINDIARHLLNTNYPLLELRREIVVFPDLFNSYVGRYELRPESIITITREQDRLYARLTGQPRFRIYPESPIKYFYKVVNAQITFVTDREGKVPRLILHQDGKNRPARRIAE
jgi:D-alanyl-D-alanine-carboxypeptidase/D-alanyl-D-alanine-endopeptidase